MAGKLQLDGIRYLLTRLKEYFVQIKDAVRSVNGVEPDGNGNIAINSVPYAENLQSTIAQQNYGTFIERSAGGASSIQDGDAWLMTAKGTYTHDGFVAEELNMTVNAETSGITATINRDTFVSYVSESGTTTLTYTTAWDADPATYGITVTGTPADGDTITVVYVKEERGTITQTTPLTFVSTGWNLYNSDTGYAKVLKYSDSYGYRVEGAYTVLLFSGTIDGTRTAITVTDGNFSVPSNGFVWVTGGDASTTAIYMTHSDWTTTHEGSFEAYIESVIDLTDFMSSNFPYGLLAVGTVQDEINLNIMQAYSRVERLEYNDVNLQEARESGRAYEYDTNYIYLARAEEQAISITQGYGGYSANDHGIEYWTGTEQPVETHIIYGQNLKNKLERDVLTISDQSLTATQKAQIRNRIGLGNAAQMRVANNLVTTEQGWLLDGRQGKNLNDKITKVRSAMSLVTPTNATGTSTIYNTYSSRKISDFEYIAFYLYDSASNRTNHRATAILPVTHWTSGRMITLTSNHGASLENIAGIIFAYASDTAFTVLLNGSKALTGFEIEGWMPK